MDCPSESSKQESAASVSLPPSTVVAPEHATRPLPPSASVSSPDIITLHALPSPLHQVQGLALNNLHHALSDASTSSASTPRTIARANSRPNVQVDTSISHSRASSVDRASSMDRSRPVSPSPSRLGAVASPLTGAVPSASVTLPAHSHPTRTSTIFDPLPPLPSRLRQAALKLVPPPNFGYVEESLYRSGEPADLSFPFLDRLKLRTLVWLAPHSPSARFRIFLQQRHISFHDLGIQHAASLDAVTDEAVTHALQVILTPPSYPLMIMCGGGSHRTGTVVGCLRKLQRWNLASIFEEYRRYAGALHHIMNEQFIEFYDTRGLHLPPLTLSTPKTDGNPDNPLASSERIGTPTLIEQISML